MIESVLSNFGATLDNNGATSPVRELAALIERSASESLKTTVSPIFPSRGCVRRMAEIVMALREKDKLSVAQMRQITCVSRNSLVRDIQVLKRLGWSFGSTEAAKTATLR